METIKKAGILLAGGALIVALLLLLQGRFRQPSTKSLPARPMEALAIGLAPSVQAGSPGPRPGTTKPTKPKGPHPYLGPNNAKVTIEIFGDFQAEVF